MSRAGKQLGPFLALSFPILLHLMLQVETLHRWWSRDDPCILASVSRHGVWAHFFDAATWKSLSTTFFTPWQVASLGADYSLAGLEPAWFFAHHLFSGLLFLGVAFQALRRLGSDWTACLALCLIVTSAPFFAVSQQLMNRHYLEGLLWITIALLLYQAAASRRSLPIALLGAFFSLLAALSKEVFVPLPLLFPALSPRSIRSTWRVFLPFAGSLLIYGLWRLIMLGLPSPLPVYSEPARFPSPGLLGLTNWPSRALFFLLAGAVITVLWKKSRKVFWPTAMISGVAVVSLLPVLGTLQPRHLLIPAIIWGAATAKAVDLCTTLGRWRVALAAGLVLFQLSALPESTAWKFRSELATYQSEGRFLLSAGPGTRLLTTIPHSHFLACLSQLGRTSEPGGPSFCGDPCWCHSNLGQAEEWRVINGQPSRVSLAEPDCATEKELRIALTRTGSDLEWQFGPYSSQQGAYSVILLWGPSASVPVPLKAGGRMPVSDDQPLRLVVRFDATEGWATYSDILEIGPSAERIDWSR